MVKKIFNIFLFLVSTQVVGQRTNASPYSFFGIGQIHRSQTIEQAGMGGLGISYTSPHHLNFVNPAGNGSLRLATYAIGLKTDYLTIKESTESQASSSTSLSYVGVGFPIGKKMAFSFGLQPKSSVGYSLLSSDEKDAETGNATEVTRYHGTGGTSKIYGTFGIAIAKGLSIGVEASFLFGKIESYILNQRADVLLATKNTEVLRIRGGELKTGIHYEKELANELSLQVGATLKLENRLNTRGSENLYSVSISSSLVETPRETIFSATVDGKITNPMKTGFGAGLGKKGKWFAGFEYEFQDALDVEKFLLIENTGTYAYGNSNRFSMGGFYIPKQNSITSYWKRVTYRAGLRFEKTGLLIRKTTSPNEFTEINDFGISFGLGLPLGKRLLSNMNLGLEYGKKGTTANELIQENYFSLRLGLSLNDSWFMKRKID